MNKAILLIARFFFSLIFIFSGMTMLINWRKSVDGLVASLSEWSINLGSTLITPAIHQGLIISAPILLGIAIFFEVVGACFILINFKKRIGASLLLVFMIPCTIIIHPFWFKIGSEINDEVFTFLKNLSLIGALLYFLLCTRSQKTSR